MTDETGILQFSRLDQPDPYSGHTLDDNARALILSIFMEEGQGLASKYLAFMDRCQQEDGSWSNLFIKGRYSSLINSEDSIGRALLALSIGNSRSNWEDIKNWCRDLLQLNLPRSVTFTSPRAIAYTLLALAIGNAVKKVHTMTAMAEYLLKFYNSLFYYSLAVPHTKQFGLDGFSLYRKLSLSRNPIIPVEGLGFFEQLFKRPGFKLPHL
jgi:hypothetical protein